MEPSSSSSISQKTAAGHSLANIARSTNVLVFPALLRTPPSLYLGGKMRPGQLKFPRLE
jgi:hypothetical protein